MLRSVLNIASLIECATLPSEVAENVKPSDINTSYPFRKKSTKYKYIFKHATKKVIVFKQFNVTIIVIWILHRVFILNLVFNIFQKLFFIRLINQKLLWNIHQLKSPSFFVFFPLYEKQFSPYNMHHFSKYLKFSVE